MVGVTYTEGIPFSILVINSFFTDRAYTIYNKNTSLEENTALLLRLLRDLIKNYMPNCINPDGKIQVIYQKSLLISSKTIKTVKISQYVYILKLIRAWIL